ncbi:Hypothetical protein CINCED_3A017578 [Cinara cedri]|uniref:Uncharacterized protein n=1 Tax=Cinara cedri TaxID=506608 RepID=A0A5E4NLB0_9HEMI|nr:Hypothetical protein CINCED_3A017578 [Cinara cedri]
MKLPGKSQKLAVWRTLNLLRTGVARTKIDLEKWRYIDGPVDCECGNRRSHTRGRDMERENLNSNASLTFGYNKKTRENNHSMSAGHLGHVFSKEGFKPSKNLGN